MEAASPALLSLHAVVFQDTGKQLLLKNKH
jgi:hypothetical protein